MDNIQSDDNVLIGNDPLDVVEHVLTAENLPFDRTEDGDLAFSLAGDWKDYELWFAWRPEGECLQLCLSIDLTVAPERRAAAHELLATVNPRVWLGHFEVWEDGEIVFRHGMPLMTGEQPTLSQAAAMIDVAVECADRFYPAFDFLIRGAKSPQDAIAACMFETVGEA
ncbi:MAG: YbjN domain-containing protein [Alphaproteobacteria bacterium]|nr:YbjN domain-containing protein [Alphaproteobacteria bacterium]